MGRDAGPPGTQPVSNIATGSGCGGAPRKSPVSRSQSRTNGTLSALGRAHLLRADPGWYRFGFALSALVFDDGALVRTRVLTALPRCRRPDHASCRVLVAPLAAHGNRAQRAHRTLGHFLLALEPCAID